MKKLELKLNLRPTKYIVCMAISLLIAAIALTWFLQYRYFINDAGRTWDFMWNRPLVFWYTTLIVYFGLICLTGITRRPAVSVGITWAGIIILTYIHINKFHARGFPLLPEDFALASESASLAKFIDVGALVRMLLSVVLVGFLAFLANYWIRAKFSLAKRPRSPHWYERWAIPSRIAMIAITIPILLCMTDFIRNHKGQRYQDIGWLNTQLVAWNQVRNYDYNGFLLGFLYNLHKFDLTAPDGYGEAHIAEIRATYEKLAKSTNKTRPTLADDDINVIIILNESFFDPAVSHAGQSFETFYPHTGGEILPTLRSVQARYPSGYMYSTDYGGGTANIEFEILTGLTNYWANTVPYTDLIPRAGDIPSVASFAKSQGYATTAIHPFNGSMYKRNIALHNFGFDKFITEREMDYTELEGNSEYINDRSAYLQTLDQLNSTDQNQLIALITMQNHLPYNPDIYTEHQFGVPDANVEDNRKSEIATYYQMLHNSDAYLGEFLSALDQSSKKTVVLFFGDHSAGIFDLTNSHEDKTVRDLSRLTPYFVYTNFDTPTRQDLPITTPNCLSNTMFDVIGVQKPTSFHLVSQVCAETPILTHAWFDAVAPIPTTALSAYETFTYDLLGGKKYWQ